MSSQALVADMIMDKNGAPPPRGGVNYSGTKRQGQKVIPRSGGDYSGTKRQEQKVISRGGYPSRAAAPSKTDPNFNFSDDVGADASYQFPANPTLGEGDLLNWMMITAYEITGGFSGSKMVQFGNPSGSVSLPIPPGITSSYEQNWSQASVPVLGQAMSRVATSLGITGAISKALGIRTIDPAGDIDDIAWGAETTAAAVRSTGLAEVGQFALGARALDQVMMSYAGPTFRNFTYNFSMKPNNQRDSYQIDQIIKFLKYKSSPESFNTRFARVYKIPSVFRIQFHSGGSENERIPKIGFCALTNITTNFGGDIFRTFDDSDHSPVQVDLSLAFKEMELLEKENFDEYRSNHNVTKGDF